MGARAPVVFMDEKKWKIRDAEGKVFGPATMESLKAWARDGRLVAGQVVSSDGKNWVPVDTFAELEMDWVTKLPDGRFFGPVNRDAMKEFIRTGDITDDMPQFVRVKSIDESPVALRAENDELRRQIDLLRKDFASRVAKLEADLAASEAAKRLASSQLSTRDLDFEAERQAFAAEQSRMEAERQGLAAEKTKLKAEIAKAEKRAEVLAAQAADAQVRTKSREIDLARIAELEKQMGDLAKENKALKTELENQAADARRALKNAEISFLKEKEEFETRLRDVKALSDKISVYQTREESLRRVILQASSILGKGNEDIADAEAVIVEQL